MKRLLRGPHGLFSAGCSCCQARRPRDRQHLRTKVPQSAADSMWHPTTQIHCTNNSAFAFDWWIARRKCLRPPSGRRSNFCIVTAEWRRNELLLRCVEPVRPEGGGARPAALPTTWPRHRHQAHADATTALAPAEISGKAQYQQGYVFQSNEIRPGAQRCSCLRAALAGHSWARESEARCCRYRHQLRADVHRVNLFHHLPTTRGNLAPVPRKP
jgi:hypothetical protein